MVLTARLLMPRWLLRQFLYKLPLHASWSVLCAFLPSVAAYGVVERQRKALKRKSPWRWTAYTPNINGNSLLAGLYSEVQIYLPCFADGCILLPLVVNGLR